MRRALRMPECACSEFANVVRVPRADASSYRRGENSFGSEHQFADDALGLLRMSSDDRSRLALGVAVSVLLHAGALLALGVSPALWTDTPNPRPTPKKRVRPGIEKSHAATINWLGFEKPTLHRAPLGQIDQPLLARNPSPRASQPEPEASRSEQAPSVASPGSPTPATPVQITKAEIAPPDAPKTETPADTHGDSHTIASAAQPSVAPPQAITPLAPRPKTAQKQHEQAKQAVQRRNPEQRPTKPPKNAASKAGPARNPAKPQNKPGGSPATAPGKDADPSSRTKPIRVVLGRPIAAAGVDIRTVRPRWTLLTRLTASPRNPLVEVQFDAKGRVHHARLLESSGVADVDGPLLDAVYQWRAKGAAIGALSEKDGKDHLLTLQFRIGLR